MGLVFFSNCSTPTAQSNTEIDLSTNPFQRNANASIDSVLEFNSMILSMFQDSEGVYWFGSWCDGMAKYDPRDSFPSGAKKFRYYNTENGIPGKEIIEFNNRKVPRGNAVRDIQEDANHNIIFATLHGVTTFDGDEFMALQTEGKAEALSTSLKYVDNNWDREYNSLWYGNISSNGVYKYENNTLKQFTFPELAEYDIGFRSQYCMYSHTRDSYGNIWFGTEAGGIFKYNKEGLTCINQEAEKGIVRCIFQDASGLIWISNVLEGLYTYDHQAFKKGVEPFRCFTKEKGFYTLNEVRSQNLEKVDMLDGIQTIVQEDSGVMWFGTFGNGLWRYDPSALSDFAFTHFTEGKGIPSDTVKSILKDKNGKLWFGIGEDLTHVYQYDGENFKRIDI